MGFARAFRARRLGILSMHGDMSRAIGRPSRLSTDRIASLDLRLAAQRMRSLEQVLLEVLDEKVDESPDAQWWSRTRWPQGVR